MFQVSEKMKGKMKFCDECGSKGMLKLRKSVNKDGIVDKWYECILCGKIFEKEKKEEINLLSKLTIEELFALCDMIIKEIEEKMIADESDIN